MHVSKMLKPTDKIEVINFVLVLAGKKKSFSKERHDIIMKQ